MAAHTRYSPIYGIVLALLALGLTGCSIPTAIGGTTNATLSSNTSSTEMNGIAETRALSSTQVVHFVPSGYSGPIDKNNTPANCWETSLAAPRADAWRCIVGNIIYDPCFSTSAKANYVICDVDPSVSSLGLKATLAHALPASEPSKETQAWFLRLTDGSVCSFLTGATGLFEGDRINYGCTNDITIAGMPHTDKIWTVKAIPKDATKAVTMSVAEAWT
jgi:hypothetical protein